ncbi:MAG: Mur ligase family protein, partial [Actinomycetota bacterium]
MRFRNYEDALGWLEAHVDFERVAPNHADVPSLEPVRQFLAAVADPQRDYPSVHITGTNGKGTTTTLTSALLHATGLRVGAFTSPDLHAINERIAVNGEPVGDRELVTLIERLSDIEEATGIELTRFELLTAGALLHFSDEGVDVAVIEVGLGGTWDSTNVIDSDVAVITNVDLDHVAVLGTTVTAIATDKVGIFRSEGTAIVGTTNAMVVEVAATKAAALGSTLWLAEENFALLVNDLAVGGRLLSVRTPFATYEEILLSLH